ncbi:MAG: NAD(+) diphosphatase [Lachnospiraceae bacterium]
MLQDIGNHQFHNEFDVKVPKDSDYVLYYQNQQVALVRKDENTRHPSMLTYKIIKDKYPQVNYHLTYLFSIDTLNFFLIEGDLKVSNEDSEIELYPLQIFRTLEPSFMAFAGITGSQLSRWYANHKYCGRCQNQMGRSTTERAVVCDHCGLIEYPKISPAIIVGITNGNKILLTRYANRPFKKYALIAGFVEIGETLEGTVRREVMEEVGVKVKNIRYFGNQPWAFSDSLLVGFFADLDGEDQITLDTDELAEAQWVERADIPINEENEISLTAAMMKAFKMSANL